MVTRCNIAVVALLASVLALASSCVRQPILHLHEDQNIDIGLPMVSLDLNVYWDYELDYEEAYDWRKEWYYGWDNDDERIFGKLGYTEPHVFHLRRYHTGELQYGSHNAPLVHVVEGSHFEGKYSWGYWDLLAWNDIRTSDGVQSLVFDEQTTYEYVTAHTNETMHSTPHPTSRSRSFYQPEELFAAYERGVAITADLDGFVYDEDRNMWVKQLSMMLEPLTYIYLTQVILHHNDGRIDDVDGNANLSGMARSVTLNDGVTGPEPITVFHNVRMKKHLDKEGEDVDIIGGRLLTFGMCNVNPNRVNSRAVSRVDDNEKHYLDVNLRFNNGKDSVFMFDVTDQVQRRYKGGVLTVELDCDTVKIPSRGASGFEPVIEEPENGGTHEFEL